jgi:hypothetical protein
MYDTKGVMTRPWVQFLERVAANAAAGAAAAGQPPTPPGGIPAAPPVAIQSATLTFRSNKKAEIDVAWAPDSTATTDNFSGAAVYLEDPDISSNKNAPLNGTTPLDGTANLSGKWNPVFENDTLQSPAVLLLDASGTTPGSGPRVVRVYLAAYGPHTMPHLVRANQSSPTPSITVNVPAYGIGNKGMEYAWLISNPTCVATADFNRPDPNYYLTFGYTPPDPTLPVPPNLGRFAGARIYYVYYDGDGNPIFPGTDAGIDIPPEQSNGGVKSPVYTVGGGGAHFRVYYCSEEKDANGFHINTLVDGVTPWVDVTVAPVGNAPDVTDFRIFNQQDVWQLDGSFVAQASFSWTIPNSVRYAGVRLYLTNVSGGPTPYPAPLTSTQSNVAVNFILQIPNVPSSTEAWTIAAISVDTDGKLSDDPANLQHSPTVIWNIGPPGPGTPGGGQEYAPLVTINAGASIAATESLSADGVRMVNFGVGSWTEPNSNKFGGAEVAMVINSDPTKPTYWSVPKGTTSFTTPTMPSFGNIGSAVPLDFYIVSDDPQGHKNSLVPGITPDIHGTYTPTEGQIIAQRFTDFDTTQFQWASVGLQAYSFQANLIQVGSKLIVGGGGAQAATFGGSQNGQIAVLDSSGTLIAWMGKQQPTQGDGTGIYGGWFKQLWVGGADPRYSPLYIDTYGRVIVGGIASANGAPYPYISIRDASGVEKGRIGASISTNSGLPGDGTGGGGPAGLTSGAWFTQLAVGGSNLNNWNMLITPDATQALGSNFQLRNVYLFDIDYAAFSGPMSNNHYKIQFGNSVWAGTTPGAVWQFPGIHIFEPDGGSQFGATFLSRGVALRGPQSTYPLLASFALFNGQSSGADAPGVFWGELVMYSPNSPYNQTVYLGSGSATSGNGYFILRDVNGLQTFAVSINGDVTIKNTLVMAGSAANPVINAAGQFVGPGVYCPNYGVAANGFNPFIGGLQYDGVTGPFTFTSADGKTITVAGGVIVAHSP